MSWEFLAAAAVVVIIPGTGVLYTLAVSLGRGPHAGLIAAGGCTLGILPHIAASILGLAALLHTSAVAFNALKIAGVLYLLWMAWSIWRGTGALSVRDKLEPVTPYRLIRDGVLLNVLNPKLSVFFLAFLPQFVPVAAEDATVRMIWLGSVFMVMTFVTFALYGAFAGVVRRRILARPAAITWMRVTFAGSFTMLALRLAFADR